MFEYKGQQFTLDQISEAAAQAGLSVDEYIQKHGIVPVEDEVMPEQQPTVPEIEVEEEVTQVLVPAGRTAAGRGRCVSLARAAAGTSGRSLAGVPTLSSKIGGRTQI